MRRQYDQANVFQKIIDKSMPADIVLEDEQCIAFRDINPQAEIHVVIIPKVESIDFTDFVNNQNDVSYFFQFVAKVAQILGISDYRLITNNGLGAGQSVFHFHMHLLAGNLPKMC